jgi:hypothetical protein
VGVFKSDYGNGLKGIQTLLKMYGWDQAPARMENTTPRDPAHLKKELQTQIDRLDEIIKDSV